MKLYRVHALLLKYLYNMKRNLDRLFDMFYFPAVGLFTWGFTTLYLEDVTQSSRFIAFFLGGFILWTLVQRAQQDISMALLEDFWTRNLYNTFSSPLTNVEVFAATTIYAVMRAVISFMFLAVLAILFYGFDVFSIGVIGVAVSAFVLTLFGSALGLFVAGMIYRFGMRVQAFAWSTVFILQPFSAVFYPRETLPGVFHLIALSLPTSYVFEGMRTAITENVVPWDTLLPATALSVVYMVVGYAVFHHFLEEARQHGYLAQEA